jgi:pentose-5-phosphate-3-epimerase
MKQHNPKQFLQDFSKRTKSISILHLETSKETVEFLKQIERKDLKRTIQDCTEGKLII